MKSCFVICPIGDDDTKEREWSDDIYKNLICHVCGEFDYQAERIIDSPSPGEITPQIIRGIMEADLVIADLTWLNPNVMYELALRHLKGLPFIQIAAVGTKIPFDTADINTIAIATGSYGAMDAARETLRAHLAAIEAETANFDNPVSRYVNDATLEASGDPKELAILQLSREMDHITRVIDSLIKSSQSNSATIAQLIRRDLETRQPVQTSLFPLGGDSGLVSNTVKRQHGLLGTVFADPPFKPESNIDEDN